MSDSKRKVGRPSKFSKEHIQQAEKLCKLGATDYEIADFFEVDVRTIHRWKIESDEFCHAIKAGKIAADERVERSLYQKAIGYEQEEVKIFMPANRDDPVYAPFTAKIAPDTTAAIFWLKNRRPDLWREKSQTELTGANGAPIQVQSTMKNMSDDDLATMQAIMEKAVKAAE